MNYMKNYLNDDYFKNGIRFPYNPKEIYTTFGFQEKSMHIFLDLNENADQYFEDTYWDKPQQGGWLDLFGSLEDIKKKVE